MALNQLLQLGGSACGGHPSPLRGLPRFFNDNPDMLRLRAGLEPHLTSNDPEVLLSPGGIFTTVRPHPRQQVWLVVRLTLLACRPVMSPGQAPPCRRVCQRVRLVLLHKQGVPAACSSIKVLHVHCVIWLDLQHAAAVPAGASEPGCSCQPCRGGPGHTGGCHQLFLDG